jgi:hypothetical protein
MTTRSTFAKGALSAIAGVMALTAATAVPSFAAAQPYGYGSNYGSGYSYDPCRRDKTNRGTVGALLGGALGAAIGSNAAARGVRTEGALLGGAVGAVAGGVVGNSSAACNSGYAAPRSSYYDNNRYDGRYYDRYGSAQPNGYYSNSYSREDEYDVYDRAGTGYRVADRPMGADGCTLAESPIYLPDGRVQKRFVRVCQDSSGRYQVVD